MRFSLDEIVQISGAKVIRPPDRSTELRPVEDLRNAAPGTIYFPMRLPLSQETLTALARAGASGVVCWKGYEPLGKAPPGILSLDSPPLGFFRLARAARRRSSALVVAVTGSSGKSSTKEYLAALLRQRFAVHATVGSLNRISECAEIILSMEGRNDEAAVIEMGFGSVGDIERMADIALPFGGIITKVTPDHLDGARGSVEVMAREKGKLGLVLPPEGVLALHAEDPGCSLIDRAIYPCTVLTFGEGPAAGVRYRDVVSDETGTGFTLELFGQLLPVRLQTYGAVQAANAAAAALIAHVLGFSPAEIRQGLAATRPMPRRFEIHRFKRGLTVIDDTFSASFDAMRRGLENAAYLAGRRRRIAVLTGFAGLGEQSADYHRSIGGYAVAYGYGGLFLAVSDERTAAIRDGALAAGMPADRIYEISERAGIAAALQAAAGIDTLFYCKGSQYLWIGTEIDAFRHRLVRLGFEPLP